MILRNRLTCSRRHLRIPTHPTRSATIVSNPDPANSSDPLGYCKDFVRKYDYESFLTSQFYPKESQGGYFALKAFYVSGIIIFVAWADLRRSNYRWYRIQYQIPCLGRWGCSSGETLLNKYRMYVPFDQNKYHCWTYHVGQTSETPYRTRFIWSITASTHPSLPSKTYRRSSGMS